MAIQEDPFEAFRKKKELEKAAHVAADAAAKEPEESGRPKGFRRGRYQKPARPIRAEAPKRLRVFQRVSDAAPVEVSRPEKFTRDRLEASPVDVVDAQPPAGFDRGRFERGVGKPLTDGPPSGFEPTRNVYAPLPPGEVSKPSRFKRY
jgi:hypothetical protein